MNGDFTAYFDANVYIYAFEKGLKNQALVSKFVEIFNDDFSIIGSELLITELLCKPLRDQDARLIGLYRRFLFTSDRLVLVEAHKETWELAAELRAKHSGLKTPDAVHAATAILNSVDVFVTNDQKLLKIDALNTVEPQHFEGSS